ncbi:MAG: transposase [gamma proteobacterium symbiont of Ctena orbiculata]|nr:transposase [Candidatus Thiodiazotropha taylori]PUB83252.1 MAG: transposase [gamma proteobacterium symbiont of Ctena orbiculata]MBT3035691.1 transposase [Candidatus Thiodiazotropha taylori]PVV07700.1 MAG: transposase [gamma proteobacterium symbiont of Ctena orbiculata]PVV14428.1 MAG: transposase [gamma proteobacterium symbiont of Ctena orbiculata]
MPRKPRFYLPGIPAHVIQRGNSRQQVFFDSDDYQAYLKWLKEGADKHGCAIHAYCLMTNHVHLLLTPESPEAISKTIQFVGRYYVPYINRTYGKSGTLWEGRHKGCVIDSEAYLFSCMRYIELNPVRAGMAQKPIDYHWSSYRGNATQCIDKLTTPHTLYRQLAQEYQDRQFIYRELFRGALEAEQVHDIRATVQTGTPLGNTHFREQIEKQLKCKVGQARRGRPKGR